MILFPKNHIVSSIRSFRASLTDRICAYLLLCTTITILTLNSVQTSSAFALSPSFSIQEVNTGVHNGIQINGTTHAETKPNYNWPQASSSDIQRVTYFSDGRTLNATLWLGGGVEKNPSHGVSTAVYGELIDADNNPSTGKYGVDYQQEVQWSNTTKSWNKIFVQYSSPLNLRTLTKELNYTGFFQNDEKYVLMPLDLKSITSPDKFRVIYYAILIYNDSRILLDLTPWIDIPPSQYTFSTTPNPIVVTQGQQEDVGVQLQSSSGLPPKLANFTPYQNYSNVLVKFNPNRLDLSSFGVAPLPLKIQASNNAQIGKYTIPVLLNLSTGSVFPSKFIQLANLNVSIPTQGYISGKGNLSISVVPPPSIDQRIKDFWSVYGSLISLIGAGFAGAASTFVFEYLKNRKSKSAPIR
ncbi:hypothetical protein [Nitrososphaera sp. AFS]|uniref:hypothetical protein n=1 Tax=Nitrososphaera sp. AFS TaxID=2301191 RepID=UPI0013922A1E|nr:hypothetical protein [Nitrososphaera sp. AFS]NAL77646.1 hypothetical protein [Nitrososphaera sp. AFS]